MVHIDDEPDSGRYEQALRYSQHIRQSDFGRQATPPVPLDKQFRGFDQDMPG